MIRRLSPLLFFFVLAVVALLAMRTGMNSPSDGSARDSTMSARTAAAEAAPVERPRPASGSRRAVLEQERDGHFWASAQVDGASIRFMVDSGASVIALTARDARRAGLDFHRLPKTAEVSTANGRVRAVRTRLDSVRIGGVEVRNVDAVILEEGLETSLLGMSFLSRLESWQVASSTMTLRQ